MAAAAAAVVKKRNEARNEEKEIEVSSPTGKKSHVDIPEKPRKEDPLPPERSSGFWKYQRPAAIFYMDVRLQVGIAGLIGGNFVANVIEKWIDPTGTKYEVVWSIFEYFFNIAFTIELGLNMYGFWFWRFWTSAWNLFDFLVVTIGVLGMLKVPLPGPLSLLRMMRAFRVFRLFKRIKSLNKIMVSLAKAVPGVSNAFFILFLVMCIYAILGVDFYGEYAVPTGTYLNEFGETIEAKTGRGLIFGEEYFGNFGLALFTMFQVLTCESWSEAVARPIFHGTDGWMGFGAAMYFASFNIIVGIVLINVVVAVLLEKMVDDTPPEVVEDDAVEEFVNDDEVSDLALPSDEGQNGNPVEPKALDSAVQAQALILTGSSVLKIAAEKCASGSIAEQDLSYIEAETAKMKVEMCALSGQIQVVLERMRKRGL